MRGRAWVFRRRETRIFVIQSFYSRNEEALDLDRIQGTMGHPEEIVGTNAPA